MPTRSATKWRPTITVTSTSRLEVVNKHCRTSTYSPCSPLEIDMACRNSPAVVRRPARSDRDVISNTLIPPRLMVTWRTVSADAPLISRKLTRAPSSRPANPTPKRPPRALKSAGVAQPNRIIHATKAGCTAVAVEDVILRSSSIHASSSRVRRAAPCATFTGPQNHDDTGAPMGSQHACSALARHTTRTLVQSLPQRQFSNFCYRDPTTTSLISDLCRPSSAGSNAVLRFSESRDIFLNSPLLPLATVKNRTTLRLQIQGDDIRSPGSRDPCSAASH